MKKYIILIIGILISINLSAQTAKDFLDTVIKKTKSHNDISIVFTYKMINHEMGLNESSNGFGSMKGDKYIINIDGQEMISNGKILWTHIIDDEEVMISEVTEENGSPIAIINSFTENVSVNFIESKDKTTKVIEIKEIEDDTFEKMRISIANEDLRIKKVHVFAGEGNEFIYEINEFKTNQNLPDSMFIFNEELHPEVEVIDMR